MDRKRFDRLETGQSASDGKPKRMIPRLVHGFKRRLEWKGEKAPQPPLDIQSVAPSPKPHGLTTIPAPRPDPQKQYYSPVQYKDRAKRLVSQKNEVDENLRLRRIEEAKARANWAIVRIIFGVILFMVLMGNPQGRGFLWMLFNVFLRSNRYY